VWCIEQLFLVSRGTKRGPLFHELTCLQSRSAYTVLPKNQSSALGIFSRTPKMSNMATNQDPALDPASSPAIGPLTEFTLFPTLPLELQRKIWRCCIQQANVVRLRLGFHSWSFSEPPLHPVLHASREARTEALRSLASLPSFTRSGKYIPKDDSMDKIELNMSNDIFLLQMEG
jgi:hypothetical protein